MGIKLLWTGATVILCAGVFPVPAAAIVGAVLMGLGAVLMWLDK